MLMTALAASAHCPGTMGMGEIGAFLEKLTDVCIAKEEHHKDVQKTLKRMRKAHGRAKKEWGCLDELRVSAEAEASSASSLAAEKQAALSAAESARHAAVEAMAEKQAAAKQSAALRRVLLL